MAVCLNCQNSGVFLRVRGGLCDGCTEKVAAEIEEAEKTIRHSAKRIADAKLLDTRIEYYEEILQRFRHFAAYEAKGIAIRFRDENGSVGQETVAAALERHGNALDAEILDELDTRIRDGRNRSEAAPTPGKRVAALEKTVERVHQLRAKMFRPERIAARADAATELLYAARLDILLEPARRSEFKGQFQEATDAYQEALYFLSTLPQSAWVAERGAEISERLRTATQGVPCRYCRALVRPSATVCPACGARDLVPVRPLDQRVPVRPSSPDSKFNVPPNAAAAAALNVVPAVRVGAAPSSSGGGRVGVLLAILLSLFAVALGLRACEGASGNSQAMPSTANASAAPVAMPSAVPSLQIPSKPRPSAPKGSRASDNPY